MRKKSNKPAFKRKGVFFDSFKIFQSFWKKAKVVIDDGRMAARLKENERNFFFYKRKNMIE